MKNRVLFIFSFVLCAANTSYGSEWNTLHKVGALSGLGAMLAAGNFAARQNEEYHNGCKKPDWNMRLTKALGAGIILFGTNIITQNTSDTKLNLAQLGAFTISLFAITDTAGHFISKIPMLKGILTDPLDQYGDEIKDSGAFARGMLVYVPLRIMIDKWFRVPSSF